MKQSETINSPRPRRKLRWRITRILLFVVGSLLALVLLLVGVALFLLTPSRLTPLVNDYASQYLKADIHFDNIDVSLWRDFPRVSVGLDGARVISYALDSTGCDTLARFERLYVSLDAGKLFTGDLDIRAVRLVGADLAARIDSAGRASWEIYTPTADTTTTESGSLSINVEKLSIEGKGRARFVDQRNATNIEATFDHIAAQRIGRTKYAIELDLGLQRVLFDTVDYDRFVPLNLRAAATVDYEAISVDSLKLAVAIKDATVEVAGDLRLADTLIYSDLTVTTTNLALERVVSFLPSAEKSELLGLRSDLQFDFDLKVNGSFNLNDQRLPRIALNFHSNNGGVSIEGRYLKIDHFAIDATAGFEPSVPENNFVDLRRMEINGTVGDFSASGRMDHFLDDYHIDGRFDGHIILSSLNYWLPQKIRLGGAIDCAVKADFWRHELKLSKIGKAELSATIRLDSLRFADDSTTLMINGEVTTVAAKNVFIVKTRFDTLNFADRRMEISGAGRDLSFATGIQAEQKTIRDSTAVYPFGGSIKAKRLNLMSADSARLRMREVAIRFSVMPHKRNPSVPKLQASIDARNFTVAQKASRIAMGQVAIKVQAELIRSDQEIAFARAARLDSLQKLYPDVARSKLAAHNRAVNPRRAHQSTVDESDIDLNPGRTVRDLIRRWRLGGSLKTKSVRISTPYMPLRTRLSKLDIEFNTDSILFHSLNGKVGRSDISVSGQITNIRRSLNARGVLNIDIDMKSDTLDVNQLIQAGNAGLALVDKLDGVDFDNQSDEQVEAIIAAAVDTSAASTLLLIPKNVALDVRLDVNHAIYASFVLDTLSTELISRNKVLQIRELSAGSDIGQLSLHALYATPSKENISTSADIELLGVDVKKLIDHLPSVDTLLPMLASFEGMVDLRAAARAKIDTAMDIVMPSLSAVASLKGNNLVLLDGETFTEISKMLSFKNKKRNLVDTISVEMRIANERVEFYPFIIQLDRYKAAVSGQHRLDMEFDYHISVLKSIIPFRVGIDIKGNLDDWDFKITQAKYKSENLPSFTYQIDSMRVNLRQEIVGVFDKLNKEAQNVQNR